MHKVFKNYDVRKYEPINNGSRNPIQIKIIGNKVTVKANVIFTGNADDALETSTFRREIINGIEKKWSSRNLKIKGFRVTFKTKVTDLDKGKPNVRNYHYIDVQPGSDASSAKFTIKEWRKTGSYRVVINMYTYGEPTVLHIKNTAAHEFGHLLGLEDAYKYYKHARVPWDDIMLWSNRGADTKISNYDGFNGLCKE